MLTNRCHFFHKKGQASVLSPALSCRILFFLSHVHQMYPQFQEKSASCVLQIYIKGVFQLFYPVEHGLVMDEKFFRSAPGVTVAVEISPESFVKLGIVLHVVITDGL